MTKSPSRKQAPALLTERFDNRIRSTTTFQRACGLGVNAGCDNAAAMASGGAFRREPPTAAGYPLILRGSKGPIRDREPAQLLARACDQGWPGTCGTP